MTNDDERRVGQVVVDRCALGELGDKLGGDNGESEGVYTLPARPDQLLKVYKPHCATPEDAARLDWLILMAGNASPADRALLKANCCWPLERVTDGPRPAHGVLLPRAPNKFETTIAFRDSSVPIQLQLDWLSSPERCRRGRIPVPTFEERLHICADIVAVADFLERKDIVYGDWSYANAFWSPVDSSGYMIDIDGCGHRRRKFVETPNWSDPIRSPSGMTDNLSDRYGVALLLARCLTGVRDVDPALEHLRQLAAQHRASDLYLLVSAGVTARAREGRPSVGQLLAAVRLAHSAKPQPVTPRASGTTTVTRPDSGVVAWRELITPPAAQLPITPNGRPAPRTVHARQAAAASVTEHRGSPAPAPSSGARGWIVFLAALALLVLAVVLIG